MIEMTFGHKRLMPLIIVSIILSIALFACKNKQPSKEEVVSPIDNQTKPEKKSTNSEEKTILCFGNSLTAGLGLEEKEAWPALLQNKLDSLGYDYEVINAGLSGETTSGGLNRLAWVLNRPVDIFILELGANDMLRGLNVQSTKENLSQILESVKEKNSNVKLVLAGMLAPPNMGPNYERQFNALFPDLAKKHDAALIPFFLEKVAAIDSLNLADGKHPNAKGQKIVLENVWTAVEPLLVSSE